MLLVVSACQDPARAPLPLTVTADPPALTAGGIVTLTSQQFVDLVLLPADTTRPNRWSNFSVLVGDDTAESWRLGPTQIAVRVPPVYTGNHEARIDAHGYDEARVPFFAVGMAYPVYGRLNAYTNVTAGTPFKTDGVLIGETFLWPGFTLGYGLLDVQSQRLHMFPELRGTDTGQVKMSTPGPSYRPNHFVFDLSPTGVVAPTVWRADPWTPVNSIPCGDLRGHYTAAELSSTSCVALVLGGHIVRNGVDTLTLPPQGGLFDGEFRLAPRGKWAVVRTRLGAQGGYTAMTWPVIDSTGSIAYTIDTLFNVSGAAFSSGGDTLFITASVRDTTAANYFAGRFALQMLDPGSGRVLASRSFTTDRVLQDVILDPVRPLLYVGNIQREWGGAQRQYLTVLDRRTLETVADIPAVGPWWVSDATLIYQGSAGRVSVIGWCGFDCGGLWVFTFDLP